MSIFAGYLRLGTAIAGTALSGEAASASGYAPAAFSADITADVLTLTEGVTFGPATLEWSASVCAVAAAATGPVAYSASFGTLAAQVGELLTIPAGSYTLATA